MSQQLDQHEMAIRYLLGDLSEEDQTQLEEQFFLDERKFEELEIAEDELIDRYVRGELSIKDRKSFEQRMLSRRIVERVDVARILAKKIASLPQTQAIVEPVQPLPAVTADASGGWWRNLFGPTRGMSSLRPLFAASLMLLIMTSVALVFIWIKWRDDTSRLVQQQGQQEELGRQIAEQRAKYGELEGSLEKLRQEREEQEKREARYLEQIEELQRQTQSLALSFTLFPGSVRGPSDSKNKVVIQGSVSIINLDLDVGAGDYSRYDAYVQDSETNTISKHPGLKPVPRRGGKYIRCAVAAKRLRPGVYNVHVEGVTTPGHTQNFEDYQFQVVSR